MVRTVAMAVGSTEIKQVQETMVPLQSRTEQVQIKEDVRLPAPQGRGTTPYTVQYTVEYPESDFKQ